MTQTIPRDPQSSNATFTIKEGSRDYPKENPKASKNTSPELFKRIRLNRLMDLKIDYAFKQLFGNEKNKAITIVFLNAILQKTGRSSIKDISFKDTEVGREYVDDKKSRLDLLVVTDANEWIDVEIQFTDKYNMVKRSIYYWSKTYQRPLQKGMGYSELRPVIAINILNFDLFSQTESYHTSYHLYEDEEKYKMTNVMEFHFIEMAKLLKDWKADKLDPWSSILARWLLLLGMVDDRNGEVYDDIYKELEVIALTDESLRETFKNWDELSMGQDQRLAYDYRLKQIMDDEAAKRDMELRLQEGERKAKERAEEMAKERAEEMAKERAEKIAEEKAEEIAEQKAKEMEQYTKEMIARQLLLRGMDVEFVAESTGLERNTIVEIQRDI